MPRFHLALPACLLALAACAQTPEEGATGGAALPVAAQSAPFDQTRSDNLLAEARAAETAGRNEEALGLYRDSALAWPDNVDAWRGLGALAAAQGQATEQTAAQFMIDRVTLYSSDDLYVQREINRSLDTWIAEQRNLPDANPTQIAYADTLSSFYDWRYASRGEYVTPWPFLNVRPLDLPAVIVSGGGLVGYVGSVAAQASQGSSD